MTNDALHTLLLIVGWSEDSTRVVNLTGGTDPILPEPFRICETSAAVITAVDLA